jgi:hypothetical protein
MSLHKAFWAQVAECRVRYVDVIYSSFRRVAVTYRVRQNGEKITYLQKKV